MHGFADEVDLEVAEVELGAGAHVALEDQEELADQEDIVAQRLGDEVDGGHRVPQPRASAEQENSDAQPNCCAGGGDKSGGDMSEGVDIPEEGDMSEGGDM